MMPPRYRVARCCGCDARSVPVRPAVESRGLEWAMKRLASFGWSRMAPEYVGGNENLWPLCPGCAAKVGRNKGEKRWRKSLFCRA